MNAVLNRLAELVWRLFIPRSLRQDAERFHDGQRVVAAHLALWVWSPIFSIMASAFDAPVAARILFWNGWLNLCSLLLLRVYKSPVVCGNSLALVTWTTFTSLAVLSGGLHSPIVPWFACLPIVALMLAGTLSGIGWTVASGLAITAIALAPGLGHPLPQELRPLAQQVIGSTGLLALVVLAFVMVWMFKDFENRAKQLLREQNRFLVVEASTDPVTGIPNRRSFDRVYEQEWKRHQRVQLPLSVVLLDIDYFKQFNDVMGHAAGDLALEAVAQAMKNAVHRPGDFVARFGGEEFVAVLPNTGDFDAARIAQRMRRAVKALEILHESSALGPYVTVSAGSGTIVPGDNDLPWDFVREVDRALYRAKAGGRDRAEHVEAPLALRF